MRTGATNSNTLNLVVSTGDLSGRKCFFLLQPVELWIRADRVIQGEADSPRVAQIAEETGNTHK
jgi:hypothetical protein